ncbi:hypothetical protein EON65_12390 [archaeon]|nr:MAG: hypothetical protein EON65_12390 [archaeon]
MIEPLSKDDSLMQGKLQHCLVSRRGMSSLAARSLRETLKNIKPELKSPLANKLIFSNGLKLRVAAGPSQRDHFHVVAGEEIYYQLKGDVELKVILPETKAPSAIVVKEGHIFRLPGGIPHSPQRSTKSLGLVVERQRSQYELDCLRWYKQDSNVVEYEEYFHCQDLEAQMRDAAGRYQVFKAGNTVPVQDKDDMRGKNLNSVYQDIASRDFIATPFDLATELLKSPATTLFSSEFVVEVYRGRDLHQLQFPRWIKEIFLYQYRGESEVFSSRADKAVQHLKHDDMIMLDYPIDSEISMKLRGITESSIVVALKNTAEELMPAPGATS